MKTKHTREPNVLKKKKNIKKIPESSTATESTEIPDHTRSNSMPSFSHSPMNTTGVGSRKFPALNPQKLRAIFKANASTNSFLSSSNDTNIIRAGYLAKSTAIPDKRGQILKPVNQKNSGYKKETERFQKNIFSSATVQEKAMNRLSASKFRYLNEKLYTSSGAEACKFFRDDPTAFKVYHGGFEQQVAKWPANPVDIIIEELKEISADLVIADFGCGDAKIARTFPDRSVHSFDLFALNDYVKVCNMAKIPLENSSVDVCIFCLSLMGTNLIEYIQEASRILKLGGLLKVAEVQSRFQDKESFKKTMKTLGFRLKKEDWTQTMFVLMEFKKRRHAPKKCDLQGFQLSPCLYKKR